jgi:sulfatase maturation enzyme AslB (radical SAM superfamily)
MKQQIQINSLALNVSLRCNSRCEICYGHMGEFSEPALMDLDTARKSAEVFLANITPEAGGDFMFFGGEPMVNWKLLEEFIPWFTGLDTPDNVVLFTITNGIALSPKRIDFLAKYNVRPITVSLNGDFSVHSAIKGVTREEFDHVIAMIKYGLEIDSGFVVPHCVLQREYIPQTYSILSFIGSLGARWINLARDLHEDWTEDERSEVVRQTNKFIRETGITVQPFSECIFDCTTCYAPSIMVYPNGDIYDSCYCMASCLRDRGIITEADCQVFYMGNVNSVDGLWVDIEKKKELMRRHMDCCLVHDDIYAAVDRLEDGVGRKRPYYRVMDVFEGRCGILGEPQK